MASGRTYNFSGMGSSQLGNIEPNSRIHISGMGKVTINGSIGRGTVIDHSGMGKLVLNGPIEEGVKFLISGMGKIVFNNRPPETVVEAIELSGYAKIDMPGGYVNNNAQYHNADPEVSHMVMNGDAISFTISANGTRVESNNGQVSVTPTNGITRTYPGNIVSYFNGRLLIDGRELDDQAPNGLGPIVDQKAVRINKFNTVGTVDMSLDFNDFSLRAPASRISVHGAQIFGKILRGFKAIGMFIYSLITTCSLKAYRQWQMNEEPVIRMTENQFNTAGIYQINSFKSAANEAQSPSIVHHSDSKGNRFVFLDRRRAERKGQENHESQAAAFAAQEPKVSVSVRC